MICKKSTLAATLAILVFGALTINSASAVTEWSDLSSVTNRGTQVVHPKAGGQEEFSRSDLSAVTHKGVGGTAKQIGHVSASNYRSSDITSVTHHN
ncbi:MAG: hypothetical protein R3330_15870 [Saprospiraceae bacterium]|nr:hypothetical protein [Saprospiraceae bacterium]